MTIRMKPIDVTNHGKDIRLNQLAPDFELTDSRGSLVKLSDFQEKKNVVLALNRGFM
jgi:peroxiredoxin